VDSRGKARFVEEHLDELCLPGKVGVEPLYRDETLKAARARNAREVHRGHSPGCKLRDELEPIELPGFGFDGDEPAQTPASGTLLMTSV
jgi:hypothetical protein